MNTLKPYKTQSTKTSGVTEHRLHEEVVDSSHERIFPIESARIDDTECHTCHKRKASDYDVSEKCCPETIKTNQTQRRKKSNSTILTSETITTFYRNDTSTFLNELKEAEELLRRGDHLSKVEFPSASRRQINTNHIKLDVSNSLTNLSLENNTQTSTTTSTVTNKKKHIKKGQSQQPKKTIVPVNEFVETFAKSPSLSYQVKKPVSRVINEYQAECEFLASGLHLHKISGEPTTISTIPTSPVDDIESHTHNAVQVQQSHANTIEATIVREWGPSDTSLSQPLPLERQCDTSLCMQCQYRQAVQSQTCCSDTAMVTPVTTEPIEHVVIEHGVIEHDVSLPIFHKVIERKIECTEVKKNDNTQHMAVQNASENHVTNIRHETSFITNKTGVETVPAFSEAVETHPRFIDDEAAAATKVQQHVSHDHQKTTSSTIESLTRKKESLINRIVKGNENIVSDRKVCSASTPDCRTDTVKTLKTEDLISAGDGDDLSNKPDVYVVSNKHEVTKTTVDEPVEYTKGTVDDFKNLTTNNNDTENQDIDNCTNTNNMNDNRSAAKDMPMATHSKNLNMNASFPPIVRRFEEIVTMQYDALAEYVKNKVYDGCRLIAFCGTKRHAGCTTMTFAAAKGVAQRGLKTIIIDANFDVPMIRSVLAETLSDEERHDMASICWLDQLKTNQSWESIAVTFEDHPLISLLPVAPKSLSHWVHNEPEQLQMAVNQLINLLHEHFDLILLDCGSFEPSFDEITWGELELFQPDSVILVHDPKSCALTELESLRYDIFASGITDFGIAENFV